MVVEPSENMVQFSMRSIGFCLSFVSAFICMVSDDGGRLWVSCSIFLVGWCGAKKIPYQSNL